MTGSHATDTVAQAIERALRPGTFIPDQACFSFVTQLDKVATRIEALVAKGEPGRAVTLYELFLAACHEKAEELDDSSGQFGQFVEGLYGGWLTAREAVGADPAETAATLLAWMEKDPYGFCYHLERRAVEIFTPRGLAAFEQAVRYRVQAAVTAPSPSDRSEAGYAQWRRVEILKTIYAAQDNIEAYLDLCATNELTPADCEVIADLYEQRGAPAEALEWVDRGLALEAERRWGRDASGRLSDMRRALLRTLGREEEAQASAWEEFRAQPSRWTYSTLMRFVSEPERDHWHGKAMAAADDGDLEAVLPLWVETREVDRLVARLRQVGERELEALSHHTLEPVAAHLAVGYPELAAKVYCALGLRILTAKKSKYYTAALAHLAQAKDCYERAGRNTEWEALVAAVHRAHGRKYGFMPGFERVVEGRLPQPKESFLDRAQRRWGRQGDD